MNLIDLKGQMGEHLLDKDKKIPKAHLKSVCKIYKKNETCRYIFLSAEGFICMKNSPLKATMDSMSTNKQIVAQGDNCEGLGKNIL